MTERQFFDLLGWLMLGLAAVTCVSLFFIPAPYGRYVRNGRWGPRMNTTAGWVVMEAVSPLTMGLLFALGDHPGRATALVFLAWWLFHYLYRAFVFPFRRRGGTRQMPVLVVALGVVFNLAIGYLNGRWLFHFGPALGVGWFEEPRFLVGALLCFVGFAVNYQSDTILIRLRKPGETGYRIPRGGLYRFVSCPNYLGEMIEWAGYALATWSVSGLTFAVWTAANLVPRAVAHHRWYRATFPDYPPERRAILPFLL